MAATGNAWLLKDACGIIAAPFRFVFNAASDAVEGFAAYFTEFDRLKAENEALKQENAELKQNGNQLEVLKDENEWLREYLDIKNQNTKFSFCDAVVTGRSSSSSRNTLTLNKGSLNGIRSGMVVIAGEGVVGRVGEVGLTFCEVICLTDITSSIGACVERSSLVGIANGAFGNECKFSYTTGLVKLEDIAVGDVVISSGSGSVFPYGLRIGTVKDLKIDESSRSVIATIKTSVDFNDVKRVMIITDTSVEEKQ